MQNKINEIKNYVIQKLSGINAQADCQALRVEILGKSGKLTELFKQLKDVPAEEKGKVGQILNAGKSEIDAIISNKEKELANAAIQNEINSAEKIDITLPTGAECGSLHPRTIIQREIEEVFTSMGFVVEDGNEVETEYNNFTAVNVPENHPARDMQDTFWLDNGEVLKTHTSASQNRILKKYTPPIRHIPRQVL